MSALPTREEIARLLYEHDGNAPVHISDAYFVMADALLARLRPACATEDDTTFVRMLQQRHMLYCNQSAGYRLHLEAKEVNRIVAILESVGRERDALRAELTECRAREADTWERVKRLEQEEIPRRNADLASTTRDRDNWIKTAQQIQDRADAASVDMRACAEALTKAALPLEALNASVQWELSPSVMGAIAEALNDARAALACMKGMPNEKA